MNVARALYFNADIIILDDPLSAVDAHVGKALFNEAILGSLRERGKTVILVTHALHFLAQCDYIYTVANGRISEHGRFNDLLERNGEFARLSKEFGGEQKREEEAEEEAEAVEATRPENKEGEEMAQKLSNEEKEALKKKTLYSKAAGKGNLEGRLMVKEHRTTGAVPWYGSWCPPPFQLLRRLIHFVY